MYSGRPVVVETGTTKQIAISKVTIVGVLLIPDGSNAATVTIHNEADNSQTASKLAAGLRSLATVSKDLLQEVYCHEGAYVEVLGTGAKAIVYVK